MDTPVTVSLEAAVMLRVTHRAWGIPVLLGAALFTRARVAVLLETAIVFRITHCAWRVPLARAFARLVSCHTIFLSVLLAGLDASPPNVAALPLFPICTASAAEAAFSW
ncbi:MAG TPA: hypothetical protein VEK34_04210 [Methylocella sp.]|nr:hypothetical protein [Methylocella sp.]